VQLLPGWLLTIAVFSVFGGFIDFLIGRVGPERAKGFLETWWIKFDDVRCNNFGRKEALFAVNLLDRWFGRRSQLTPMDINPYIILILDYFWAHPCNLPKPKGTQSAPHDYPT
jgi:hypothetical protein